MTKFPTLKQIMSVLEPVRGVHEFVVYYNELEEDFTRAIATRGTLETVQNDAREMGFTDSEVAEVVIEGNTVKIFLL